ERAQADLQRELVRRRQVDERSVEVVPVPEDREERDRQDERHREGEHDSPVDVAVAAAVNPGGVFDLARDRHEELARQEDQVGLKNYTWRENMRRKMEDPKH